MQDKTQTKMTGAGRSVIDAYLALPLGAKPSCPYFNNRRRKSKSQLRVLKGKGTPEEIAEEAFIDLKHSHVPESTLSTDTLKEFLVDRDLGVDCSGFAYHVLDAFAKEKTGRPLRSFMTPIRPGFIGQIIARLRRAENTGVNSFADARNSKEIKISEAKIGDVIVFLGTGKDKTYNHILVIEGVERNGNDTRINYAHSYAWPSDGTYNHGVRIGDILIHGDDLLGGTWKENGKVGSENYTYESARNAREVSTRRLKFQA